MEKSFKVAMSLIVLMLFGSLVFAKESKDVQVVLDILSPEENDNIVKIIETDKNFSTAFFSADDNHIILKNGQHIRIYNITNDTEDVVDVDNAIISYDMDRIVSIQKTGNPRANSVVLFKISNNYSVEGIWLADPIKNKNIIFAHEEFIEIIITEVLDWANQPCHCFIYPGHTAQVLGGSYYKGVYEDKNNYYEKYQEFNRNLNKISCFDSIEKDNEKLQINIDNNKIIIKNVSTDEIYKTLRLKGKFKSANFSNDGNKIAILLNNKKVLIWDISK